MNKKRYTVTSALPYANGPLHIGHISGAYLPADIYVRYLKGIGHDVAFICGSDEHGAAITLRAKKENTSPKEIVDKFHALNKKSFEKIGINFSIYHRTSAKSHHETAQDIFLTLKAIIYLPRKLLTNTTILYTSNFLQTGILLENVQNAAMNMHMVISVKNVEQH